MVQQTTVIQVGSQKSVGGAVALAFLFGPLGMLYSTVPGAVVMFIVSIPIVIVTLGLGLLITIPVCMVWAGMAASAHNKRMAGVASHQVAPGAPVPVGAWHDDPDGSGRLRYHDGVRWTDHYSGEPGRPAPAQTAAALPQVVAEEPDSEELTVTLKSSSTAACGSCGREIGGGARFCPACGEALADAQG